MIRDLAVEAGAPEGIEADVLIVGGGTVGLVMADALSRAGRRVVVLESGGEHQGTETHPLNAVVQLGAVYQGASEGRFRCLGGTSTRWGGAMLPFLRADLAAAEAPWPLSIDDFLAFRERVETLFGLSTGPYELDEPHLPGHVARLAKWPSFARRNVAALLDARLRAAHGPEIWLNATATNFETSPDGRLTAVTARSPDGRAVKVRAAEVVIAAGAIESTRLLLLIDRQHDDRIFAPDDVLGRYFHDHLSVRVADLKVADRRALNRVAGFRFEGAGMRNLRFEMADDAASRGDLPASFAHIAFRDRQDGGLDALRDLFRSVQQRQAPRIADLTRLIGSAPWLARAVWWRAVEKRLLYPDQADIELHMVIEQAPRPENRITLATEATDVFGCPLAAIDWRIDRRDEEALTRAVDAFQSGWEASALARLATIERRPAGEAEAELSLGGGIYHPGGSTRLGLSPLDGVLDRDFRAFRIANLTVMATSAFPTGGGANPTMMLLMAGLRAAEAISARAS